MGRGRVFSGRAFIWGKAFFVSTKSFNQWKVPNLNVVTPNQHHLIKNMKMFRKSNIKRNAKIILLD